MSTKNDVTRMTVELPKELHRRAKSAAALHGKSVRELIIAGLDRQLEKMGQEKCPFKNCGVPNPKTRKILDEVMRGEGLIKGESLDEFFKKVKS